MPESLISDPIALADNVTGYFLFADPKFVDVTDESFRDGTAGSTCLLAYDSITRHRRATSA